LCGEGTLEEIEEWWEKGRSAMQGTVRWTRNDYLTSKRLYRYQSAKSERSVNFKGAATFGAVWAVCCSGRKWKG
jgi:hypothetical protein